jgi:hypothetical protein
MNHESDINPLKRRSSGVLMGLILLMFFIQTIHVAVHEYRVWLAFVQYAESPDQSVAILEENLQTPTLLAISGMQDLFITFRLGIADSIMVGP